MKKALYGILAGSLYASLGLAGGPEEPITPPPLTPFHPFVGVNYSYMNVEVNPNFIGMDAAGNDVEAGIGPSTFSGIDFEMGLKYGKYLGLDWGYTYLFSESDEGITARPNVVYFDTLAYWPIYNFDFIGAVGGNITDFGPASPTKSSVNFELGLGGDYYFTPNWGIQVMWRFVPSHDTSSLSYVDDFYWTINGGIYYVFS